MLKKRLIGVVTVKNGWAVQSIGYRRYMPLGKPECLVENLDRWGADEILIQVIDQTTSKRGPDYKLLDKLARLGLGTPLIYGGGVHTVSDGVEVIQSGADRFTVDALLHDDLSLVQKMGERLGAQAVIASIPMSMGVTEPEWLNYRDKTAAPFNERINKFLEQGVISEILLTDWEHEGMANGFDNILIEKFPNKTVPLIAFGGISSVEQMHELIAKPNITAIAVGNFLNYREHSIQHFKNAMASTSLRPPMYVTENSLLAND